MLGVMHIDLAHKSKITVKLDLPKFKNQIEIVKNIDQEMLLHFLGRPS